MANPIGTIPQPSALTHFGTVKGGAIGELIQLILNALVVGAGVFVLFNLIFAGYAFFTAGDDPKKVSAAWQKIYLSVLGLIVVAGAFVLAAIFGWLIYGRFDALLKPEIPSL